MKIAFLFDVKLKKYNGHYYSINLNQQLWQERYLPYFNEIVLVCRAEETKISPENNMHITDGENISVVEIRNNSPIKRILNLHKENQEIESIIKNCDAVICRGFLGAKQCRKLNKPYIIEVVSCLWDSMWNHSLLGKFFALPMYLNLKKEVKKAPYVLYVTQQFLQSRYPTKGINIGVSDVMTMPMNDQEAKKRIEKANKIKEKKIIKLGTTAAVDVAYKGQRFVIQAMSILKNKGINNIEYHLAGGGDSSALKEYADKYGVREKVFFHGSIKHEKVKDFLDDLDIYIQPSLQEGLPRALVEAMSRGLPCIGTCTGGIPELLEKEYICGRKKSKVAKEIAEKIEMMIERDDLEDSVKYSIDFAKEFEKEVLDYQRKQFMETFIDSIKIKRK